MESEKNRSANQEPRQTLVTLIKMKKAIGWLLGFCLVMLALHHEAAAETIYAQCQRNPDLKRPWNDLTFLVIDTDTKRVELMTMNDVSGGTTGNSRFYEIKEMDESFIEFGFTTPTVSSSVVDKNVFRIFRKTGVLVHALRTEANSYNVIDTLLCKRTPKPI